VGTEKKALPKTLESARTVRTRGVHGSGKHHWNPIPMRMGIAIRLMMGMEMEMGIKPMGMGIAYISRV